MADRADVGLLVQLAQWGSAVEIEAAQQAIWAENFDPQAASTDDVTVSRILNCG